MSFFKDLAAGKNIEQQIYNYTLSNRDLFFKLLRAHRPARKFADYDFMFQLSVEVKNDKYLSPNICFEWFNPKTNKPSGILACEADYIVYVTAKQIIYFDRVQLLFDLIEASANRKASKLKIINRVGDGNSNVALLTKKYVLANFKSIKHVEDISRAN